MPDIRILIVEDDPFIAMDIETAVAEEFADAQLVTVASLAAARDAVAQPVSCALFDIDVIGGKTFEVAQSLHAKGTPIAFVSGSSPADVPEPLQSVRFMRKPFSPSEITGFVVAAVSSAER